MITSLITLKLVLQYIDKISIVIDLEIKYKIKKLKYKNPDKLELLQEELWFRLLRNKFWKRLTNYIEDEIDLRRQTKKKIDKI